MLQLVGCARTLAVAGLAVAIVSASSVEAGRTRATLEGSPHLEVIPDPGPCDVVITPANQATTLPLLDDVGYRVFCVDPGDYRAAGHVRIRTAGAQTARRHLRYNAPFPGPPAIRQTQRAIFHALDLERASWWVIQGITVQPNQWAESHFLVTLSGSSQVLFDGNLVDASLQPHLQQQVGVRVQATPAGVPSQRNSIQRNVIREGNKKRLPVDYTGVQITSETLANAHNEYNKVLDNEIYDWGDGIQLSADPTCTDVGRPRGTIIDGNDIYITAAKRVRCSDGEPDPNGECSCAENGIDVKTPAGVKPHRWTVITNNRLWGFRPTLRSVPTCGGTGSRGQAITAGNICADNVFVSGNTILDSTGGIVSRGGEWVIAGNLLSEIRTADAANGIQSVAIEPMSGPGSLVQFNTIVAVDNAYRDTAPFITAQCNAVLLEGAGSGAFGGRDAEHVVQYNHLYETDALGSNLTDPTSQVFATAEDSENHEHCFLRKRWTAREEVCIPFGRTTRTSPHTDLPAECSTDLGAEFGIPSVAHP